MRTIALGLLAAVALAGGARADDKSVIQGLNDRFSAAAGRGDAAAVAAMYAPGATVLPPDGSVVTGKAIRPYMDGLVKGVSHLSLVTTNVVRLSPVYLREIGTVSFDTVGDKSTHVSTTYVVVWKKVGAGWKLWTDIFH